jgi:hypothetical protein
MSGRWRHYTARKGRQVGAVRSHGRIPVRSVVLIAFTIVLAAIVERSLGLMHVLGSEV